MIENNDVTGVFFDYFSFEKKKTPKATKIITPHPKRRVENFKPQKVNIKIYDFRPEIPRQRPLPVCPRQRWYWLLHLRETPTFDLAKKSQAAAINCSKTLHKMLHEPLYWLDLFGSEEFAKIQKSIPFTSDFLTLVHQPIENLIKSVLFGGYQKKKRPATNCGWFIHAVGILLGKMIFRSSREVGHGFVSWRVLKMVANGEENSPLYMDQQHIIILNKSIVYI